jgi:TolA-binding protein
MFHLKPKSIMVFAAHTMSGIALIAVAILSGPLVSEAQAANNGQPAILTDIGMELEKIRLLPIPERQNALEEVARSMNELMRADISSEQRSAAHFLSGEIRYDLGNYLEAAEEFRKSEKASKHNSFSGAAAAAAIMALEAAGRDDDAARAWMKWEKKYENSPFLPEVLMAQAWNALRRDTLAIATKRLEQLTSSFPWMEKDPRTILLIATVAHLEERPADALAVLTGEITGAAATYLRALCYEAEGAPLKAAAQYQEVAERYPDSTLRDHAMQAKANIFMTSGVYRSATEEFALVVEEASQPAVHAEAALRHAASVFLDGDAAGGADLLRDVVENHTGTDQAARAQLLLGEVLFSQSLYKEAIPEFNRVLTDYFEHSLAARAQYRVGRCLDALGRQSDATSTYQAVVTGYPLAPEAPAAAYLAGVGLLEQDRPLAAVPYFQLVLDRYARDDSTGTFVFASPDHQELVEASLCLLELSYHRAGDLGQLSGVPHLMLQKMPRSHSSWRAYALLIDADALAAQARHTDAQATLEELIREFPEHPVGIPANRLLAWTFAQQGRDDLAIETEERMLARYATHGDAKNLSSAYLNKAHILFNRKSYQEAAATYDEFVHRFPDHPQHLLALYQAGLCYLRLSLAGDAVDRWEDIVAKAPDAEIAERAWLRAGDLYFQAERFEDAKRCYRGLLDHFANSRVAALGSLRLAQCEYNAGRDPEALELYSAVVARFPDSAEAREAERGIELSLYRLGQREDGSEVLAQLVERYPTSAFAADAQFEIAMRHYEEKTFPEAADEFRRVVSQFPAYSAADRAHFLMADCYSQIGSAQEARLAYEQFLLFFPESELRTTVRFRLGSLRFGEGDYMRAAVDFTSILDADDSEDLSSASLYNLALCHRMMGEVAQAQEALERYREQHSADDERAADVAYQLGDIHDSAGRTELAAEEFKRALASQPTANLSIELYYRLGQCREQLGDHDGAISAYKKAGTAKDKADAFRLSAVARCAALYEEKGKLKEALSAYYSLIEDAEDPELVLAAEQRASQLETIIK